MLQLDSSHILHLHLEPAKFELLNSVDVDRAGLMWTLLLNSILSHQNFLLKLQTSYKLEIFYACQKLN
jgi:hypothetical protein